MEVGLSPAPATSNRNVFLPSYGARLAQPYDTGQVGSRSVSRHTVIQTNLDGSHPVTSLVTPSCEGASANVSPRYGGGRFSDAI